jgi:hypothetical protein
MPIPRPYAYGDMTVRGRAAGLLPRANTGKEWA